MKTKTAAAARKIDLLLAQIASLEGRHADARALFAKHGIGYYSTTEGN